MSYFKTVFLVTAVMSSSLCLADDQWGDALINNGNFTQGTGTRPDGWNTGYFDGATGTVEWVKTNDPEHANALVMSFKEKPKGMIQVDSKVFRLPSEGPRRIQLTARYRGAAMLQIRFYTSDANGELKLLKNADGSGVKLDKVLDNCKDWKESVTEWTLSKERLSQNLQANVVIMFWPSKSEFQISKVDVRFDKPTELATKPTASPIEQNKTTPPAQPAGKEQQ